MTQITITIDNASDAAFIKKFLWKFENVTFESMRKRRKSSYEQACEDIEKGKITYCESVEDMFNNLNS